MTVAISTPIQKVSGAKERATPPTLGVVKRKGPGRPAKITPSLRAQIVYLSELGVPASIIADRHLKGTLSDTSVLKVIHETILGRQITNSGTKKFEVGDPDRPNIVDVDLASQLDHCQVVMASSFNHGYGPGTPVEALQNAIQTVAADYTLKGQVRQRFRELTPTQKMKREYQLRALVNGRDRDKVLGQLREHLKKQVEFVLGFHGSSDKDSMFGDLDALGKFILYARAQLDGERFKPKQLVDALLITVYGEKARTRIEQVEKHLVCPRCQDERSYVLDKDPQFYLCCRCGRRVSVEKAKFKVRPYKVDLRYLATVQRLLANAHVNISSQESREVSVPTEAAA